MSNSSSSKWGPRSWMGCAWIVVALQLALVLFLTHASNAYPDGWNNLEVDMPREEARKYYALSESKGRRDHSTTPAPLGVWVMEVTFRNGRIDTVQARYRWRGSDAGFVVLDRRPPEEE